MNKIESRSPNIWLKLDQWFERSFFSSPKPKAQVSFADQKFLMGQLIYKYESFWLEIIVESLILMWRLRPLVFLFNSDGSKPVLLCCGQTLYMVVIRFNPSNCCNIDRIYVQRSSSQFLAKSWTSFIIHCKMFLQEKVYANIANLQLICQNVPG